MIEDSFPDINPLRADLSRRVDKMCDQFEAAWQKGAPARIEEILVDAPEPERTALLKELILVEVYYRRQQGETCQPEEYQSRFPHLDDNWLAEAVTASPSLALSRAKISAQSTGEETMAETGASAGETPRVEGFPRRHIGNYELLEEIGRGGMGVVYKARQIGLDRVVALKMILAGIDAGPKELARFRMEAGAAARLRHFNIVQIYEIGEHDGRPYFSLEFVNGGNLAQQLRGTPLPPRPSAELVLTLARAIHFAHQQGVVHRDLKPGNILLQRPEDKLLKDEAKDRFDSKFLSSSLQSAIPKIADFGLAKRLDAPLGQTQTGMILGTPSYMAPEQAGGGRKEIGPLVDVYALGAILYELMTGRPPFKAPTSMDTLLQVQSQEPVPPSRLQPRLSRDLETICLKCLQKEPLKRYPSAEALAEDLHRWLTGKPIVARRASVLARLGKWARRRPAAAALVGVISFASVLLVAGLLVSNLLISTALGERTKAFEALREEEGKTREALTEKDVLVGQLRKKDLETKSALEAKSRALTERTQTLEALRDRERRISYFVHLALGEREWLAKNLDLANKHLRDCQPKELRGWEWRYLNRLCNADLLTLKGPKGPVRSIAFSPDGKLLASGWGEAKERGSGGVSVWNTATGQEALFFPQNTPVDGVAFSPDGKKLAFATAEGRIVCRDAATGKELLTLPETGSRLFCLAFSPDGQQIAAAGSDKMIRIWNTSTGRWIRTLEGHVQPIYGIAFSPTGQLLASADGEPRSADPAADHEVKSNTSPRLATPGVIKIWDLSTGEQLRTIFGHAGAINGIAFSPDGQRLASASEDRTVRIWNAETGQEIFTCKGHENEVNAVAFSPDGLRLASASGDRTIKVWNAKTGQEVFTWAGHRSDAYCVVFSPDGERLASGGADKVAKIWDGASGPGPLTLRGHEGRVAGGAFSPDGKRFASAGYRQEVRIWETLTGKLLATLPRDNSRTRLAFSRDGSKLAVGKGNTVEVCNATNGRENRTFTGGKGQIYSVAISADGKYLAAAYGVESNGGITIWEMGSGKVVRNLQVKTGGVWDLAFSPNGQQLSAACGNASATNGEVRLWDTATGREILTLKGSGETLFTVAFSPDGKLLAAAGGDYKQGNKPGQIKIWNLTTRQELFTLRGNASTIFSMAFSPDGKRLASASGAHGDKNLGDVKIWDLTTGQEILTLGRHAKGAFTVAFSPDGKRLLTGDKDGMIRIWDAEEVTAETQKERRAVLEEGLSAWHESQAAANEQAQEWFAAWFHLTRAIQSNPSNNLFHIRRARALANLEKWDLALASLTQDARHADILSEFDKAAKQYPENYSPDLRLFLIEFLARNGNLDRAAQEVEALAKAPSAPGELLYELGRISSVLATVAGTNAKLRKETGNKLADQYATRAVALLAKAQIAGFFKKPGRFEMLDAKEFDPLRRRDDFQVLLAKLAVREIRNFGLDYGYWMNRVVFTSDGRKALVAGGGVFLYDLENGKQLYRFMEVEFARLGLTISQDGRYFLTGHTNDKIVRLGEVQSGKELQQFVGHKAGVTGVALAPDAKLAVSAGKDETLRLWETKTGKELRQFSSSLGTAQCVAFAPDGRHVLAGYQEGPGSCWIRLWDVETAKEARRFVGHSKQVTAVVFLPDGRSFLSSSLDGTLRLWDVASGKERFVIRQPGEINWAAVSPDGRRALSAGSDKTMRLWDLTTRQELHRFEGHREQVRGVAFSPDGSHALSSDAWGHIHLWRLPEPDKP